MASATTTFPPSTTTTTATPSCTTAVPGHHGYLPPDACNANWPYAPSLPAAIAFSVLFGILFLAHFSQAVLYRKPFCWVMIMGVGWELVAFVTRAIGSLNQQSQPLAFISLILFLLAPLWVNAFVYMTAGRLVWMIHPEQRVWKIKAISTGKYFVWLDIISFLVQAVGGTMLNPGNSASTMKTGKNLYMFGVGIQQFFIILFFAVIVRFHLDMVNIERNGMPSKSGRWKWLTYALYASLLLISVRIIFRLVEFSAGADLSNRLPYVEGYALGLDAAMMVLAIGALAVIHPGMVLKGPESEFPSRKERKAEKKAKKAAKKAEKMERKALGRGAKTGSTYVEPARQQSGAQGLNGDVELGVARPAHTHREANGGVDSDALGWNTRRY